tara:strand:- start:7731 stop:8486 length:756 start_codon:yes stop_codon:yes gene_type:complete
MLFFNIFYLKRLNQKSIMQLVKDGHILTPQQAFEIYPSLQKIWDHSNYQDVRLILEKETLSLKYSDYSPFSIDIDQEVKRHLQFFYKNSPYNELLARAIGHKKESPVTNLCDATGGFLSDSIMFISLGITDLTIYEREVIPSLMISNALQRSQYHFHFQSESMNEQTPYDVIYFDPMYEDKNTKSAPKKAMKVLRDVIGEDKDSVDQAEKLMVLARHRFVVKRPIKSKAILPNVSHEIRGKSTRYDVYINV